MAMSGLTWASATRERSAG